MRINTRFEQLENFVGTLEQKLDDLENPERGNNLIIYGINEQVDENPGILNEQVLEGIFSRKLGVKVTSMERIHRLGRQVPNRKRPVIFKLIDFREKETIIRNAKKLKGDTISIGEDFSYRVRNIRKEL